MWYHFFIKNTGKALQMGILDDLKAPCFYEEGKVELDFDSHVINVVGMLATPLKLLLKDIKSMKKTVVSARLTSVSGWSVRAEWGGVLFSDFIKTAQPGGDATHVTFRSAGGYDTTVSIEDLLHPRVLLCYEVGGEQLDSNYGGPVRMVIPNLWGYKSCKGLSEIEFTDEMKGGYWEDRGYPADAVIKPGKTLDVNSGRIIELSGGEVMNP